MRKAYLLFASVVLISSMLVAQLPPPPPTIPTPQPDPSTQGINDPTWNLGDEIQRSNEQIRQEIRLADTASTTAAAAVRPISLVPADIELRHVATPAEISSDSERLRELHAKAGQQLLELRNYGWQLSFAGLTALLSMSGDSDDAERMMTEARQLARDYIETQAEIESITHDRAKAEQRKEQYLRSLTVITKGNYAVNVSASTALSSPNQWAPDARTSSSEPTSKKCQIETKTADKKVRMKTGSDGYGNPIYSDEYDVYQVPYLVCE